jgi:hypothetical protein
MTNEKEPEPTLDNPEASYDPKERAKEQLRKKLPHLPNGDREKAEELIDSGVPLEEVIRKYRRPKRPEPSDDTYGFTS